MLKLGNTNINKAYLGGTEIKKMYLGNDIVFDNTVSAILPFNGGTTANMRIATNTPDEKTP